MIRFLAFAALCLMAVPAIARDGYGDRPTVCAPADKRCQDWIANVKQPDHRDQVCCAEADSYITDDWEIDPKTKQLYAIVTVPYPGVPVGTRIPIPPNKINRAADDGGNRSGHSVTFAVVEDGNPPEFFVYCWLGGTLS